MNKSLHVIAAILVALMLIVITFISDNILILFSEFIFFIVIFRSFKCISILGKNFKIFIPFFVLISVINIFFSDEGSILLVNLFNKDITLEALIYSMISSFKLFIVILNFSFMSLIIDSDEAISYFSSIMPKSTFMLLIVFKLFPYMRSYINNLKDIYAMRGIDFQGRKLTHKVKSIVPVISVMLENSMEGAFDIGEAAYVRGFFSGKRTSYDKRKMTQKDYIIILAAVMCIIFCIIFKLRFRDRSYVNFNEITNYVSIPVISASAVLMMLATILNFIVKGTGEK